MKDKLVQLYYKVVKEPQLNKILKKEDLSKFSFHTLAIYREKLNTFRPNRPSRKRGYYVCEKCGKTTVCSIFEGDDFFNLGEGRQHFICDRCIERLLFKNELIDPNAINNRENIKCQI